MLSIVESVVRAQLGFSATPLLWLYRKVFVKAVDSITNRLLRPTSEIKLPGQERLTNVSDSVSERRKTSTETVDRVLSTVRGRHQSLVNDWTGRARLDSLRMRAHVYRVLRLDRTHLRIVLETERHCLLRVAVISTKEHHVLPRQFVELFHELESVGRELLVDLSLAHLVQLLDWNLRIFGTKLE